MNKYCTRCGTFLEDASSAFCPMCGSRTAAEPERPEHPRADCPAPECPPQIGEAEAVEEEPCAHTGDTCGHEACESRASAAPELTAAPAWDGNDQRDGAAEHTRRKRITDILKKHASSERFAVICKLLLTEIILAAVCFVLVIAGLFVGANGLKTNLPSIERFLEDFADEHEDWFDFDIDIDFDSGLNDFVSADMSGESSMPGFYDGYDGYASPERDPYESDPSTEAVFGAAVDVVLVVLVVCLIIGFAAGLAIAIIPAIAMFRLRRNSLNEALLSKESMSALTAIKVILIIMMALLIFNGITLLPSLGSVFALGLGPWAQVAAGIMASLSVLCAIAAAALGAAHYGLLASTVGSIRNFISGSAKAPRFYGFNTAMFIINAVSSILLALILAAAIICVFGFVHTPVLKEFLLGFASLGILSLVCSAAVSIFSAKLFGEIRRELAAE